MEDTDAGLHPAVDGQSLDEYEDVVDRNIRRQSDKKGNRNSRPNPNRFNRFQLQEDSLISQSAGQTSDRQTGADRVIATMIGIRNCKMPITKSSFQSNTGASEASPLP